MFTAVILGFLQIALHAIGDKANDEVASVYNSLKHNHDVSMVLDRSNNVFTEPHSAKPRHRVEHVQHVSGPESLEAMREAGIVAVTNPLHLVPDLEVIQAALGDDRSRADLAFPSRALIQVMPTPLAVAPFNINCSLICASL